MSSTLPYPSITERVNKCSIEKMVSEIKVVYDFFNKNAHNSELSQGDILSIQSLVQSENYP